MQVIDECLTPTNNAVLQGS